MKIKMERHPDFHSLVEYFESDLVFYGENNIQNGGADFIRSVDFLYGLDAPITFTVTADIDGDGVFEETIFTGQLDCSTIQEFHDNKIKAAIIRTDMWAKFIARKDTPVNLRSTTDLDGNAKSNIDHIDLDLQSQKVRQKYEGHGDENITHQYVIPNNQFGQIDFPDIVTDEIDERYNLPLVENSTRPTELFMVEYGGSYNFNIKVYTTTSELLGSSTNANLHVKLQINDDTAITLVKTNAGTNGVDGHTIHTYSNTIVLNKGDFVRLYFENNTGGSYTFVLPAGLFGYDSYMIITADTVFPSTIAQGYFAHDVAAAILARITAASNPFYSEILGRTDTNARTYSTNGCYSGMFLASGLHIRGYTFDEKQFSMSFEKWWKGMDPIFNLGLGYDTVNGTDVIRVEDKEYFYDATTVSVYFKNVRQISWQYDDSRIFNKIEVGYSKWKSDEISGIDDPQTKRTYATRIQKVDNTLQIYSEFIAASIAIEVTRRKTLQETEDYRYDDDVFIIAINPTQVSPDHFRPELDEDFDSVSNLLNSSTRYNLVLTPLRNLLRWGNYWNGCLQKYRTDPVRFVSGEGNYDMVSDYSCTNGDACLGIICDSLSEKQNIPMSTYSGTLGYIHLPKLYTVEIINFSWDDYLAIRNNRRAAIAISQTESDYKKFFIKELTFDICKGKCTIQAWAFEDMPIRVIQTNMPDRVYDDEDVVEDCGERVRLLEDGDERITEAGECRNLEDGGAQFFYNTSEITASNAQYFYNTSEITASNSQYFYNTSEL